MATKWLHALGAGGGSESKPVRISRKGGSRQLEEGDYGAALGPRKPRQWESLGQPSTLLLGAVLTLVVQCLPLALIVGQFFSPSPYLMSCNPVKVGDTMAYFCEWSKTYVRSFPLLGFVVAIIVASRTFFLQRIYYELLRRVALLDFENFRPYHDPLFLILVWCLANAILHFVLNLATADYGSVTDAATGTVSEVRQLASFYLVPAHLFLIFLWKAYDVEAPLVPLSKYLEEEPEAARGEVGRMPVIPEAVGATIAEPGGPLLALSGAVLPRGKGRRLTGEDDLLDDFIRHAEAHMGAKGREGDGAFPPPKVWKEKGSKPLSLWRLAWGDEWVAALLLDKRLSDASSVSFRMTWRIVYVIAIAILVAVGCCFAYQVYRDVEDVTGLNGGPKQREDVLSLLVMLAHTVLVAFLSYAFLCRGA